MAIINSITIGKGKGSLGNVTLRLVSGDTVASQKVSKKGAGGTFKQVAIRARWGNLVNIYQAFEGSLKKCFEFKPARVSDFNAFVARNINGSSVYLTASESRQGGAVISGLQISEGSMPSISHTLGTGDVIVSDITLGSLNISASTTVKAFSDAVVNNNPAWQYGDQLSLYVVRQAVNAETNVPYVLVTKYEITLDDSAQAEEDLLRDYMPSEAVTVVDGKLGMGNTVNGACCYVHSRIASDGSTQVSTQRLVAQNSILANYQTTTQRNASIISYKGELEEAFITPNIPDVPVVPNP